jgi:hypothetical protein
LSEDLLHRLSFCELIDQLVQVAQLLHQRIFDLFDTHTAHDALDERAIRMKARCLSDEGFDVVVLLDLLL